MAHVRSASGRKSGKKNGLSDNVVEYEVAASRVLSYLHPDVCKLSGTKSLQSKTQPDLSTIPCPYHVLSSRFTVTLSRLVSFLSPPLVCGFQLSSIVALA